MATALQTGAPSTQSSVRPVVLGDPDQTTDAAGIAAGNLGAGQLATDAVASEIRNIPFILSAAGLGLYIGYNIPVLATYAIPPSDNNPETLHDFQIASAAFGALAGLVFAWRTN